MLAAFRLTALCLTVAVTGCAAFADCNNPCGSSGGQRDMQARLDKAEKENRELLSQNADLTSNAIDLAQQDKNLAGENNGLERRNAALMTLDQGRKNQVSLFGQRL